MQEEGALQQKFSEFSSPNKLLANSAPIPDRFSPSLNKGKKRERPDHSADEFGWLSNVRAVDELMARMKQEQTSAQRSDIAGAIATTTSEEWLQKFVQLGGVSILDDWIQNGAKAMAPDSASPKDADNGVDAEMMMILQALERLPIGLEALRGCSVGKSVNHLRTLKNVEVQKKARKLVDVWKKRVESEMKTDSIALSSSKSGEIAEGAIVPASESTELEGVGVPVGGETLVMTTSNASTSDVSSKAQDKTLSEEKDQSKKIAHPFTSSITSTSLQSTTKRQKHSGTTGMEISNAVKGTDVKAETSAVKTELDTNDSKMATNLKERANEYRKKLRSCGSASAVVAPCSTTDLPTNVSLGQDVPRKHEKFASESDRSMDGNSDDSKQHHAELSRSHLITKCSSAEVVNLECDSANRTMLKSVSKEEPMTDTHVVDENHVIKGCLSSQSNSQISQAPGGTELLVESNMVGSSDGKQPSLKIGDCSPKSWSSEADLGSINATIAIAALKQEKLDIAWQAVGTDEGEPGGGYSSNHAAQTDVCADSMRLSVLVKSESREEKKESDVVTCKSSSSKGTSYAGQVLSARENQVRTSEIDTSSGMDMSGRGGMDLSDRMDVSGGAMDMSGDKSHPSLDFDLNEGLALDEFVQDSEASCGILPLTSPTKTESASSRATGTLTAPIAVCAASRGTFIPPPVNSLSKCDIGWKGSAATSAFRPAEPRNVTSKREATLEKSTFCVSPSWNVKNFDLNVADDQGPDCLVKVPVALPNTEIHGAILDLNGDGEGAKNLGIGSHSRLPLSFGKSPLLDFDLNEQLDDEGQQQEEQDLLPSAAIPSHNIIKNPSLLGGPVLGPAMSASKVLSWDSSSAPSFVVSSTNLPRPPEQQFLLAPTSLPVVSNSRQPTTTVLRPTLPSVVYSQAPIFGCPPAIPFPAGFSYSPASALPDSPFLSKSSISPAVSSQGFLTRLETPLARPSYVMSMDNLCGGTNGFYTWGGGPNSSLYSSTGPAIIGYKDAPFGGKDQQFVNVSVNTPRLEEQVRVFHQSAAPVTSLKRDTNYFLGMKHTALP